MKNEKTFRANKLKNGLYIVKVQINGTRKSFYGKTENECIQKANEWYNKKLLEFSNEETKEIKPKEHEVLTAFDENEQNPIYERLTEINNYLKELCNAQNKYDDRYMTVKEVSKYLQISLNQTYALINQPDFPRQKIGKSIRVSYLELTNYLKKYRFSEINIM